jgi:GxxExxY protein
MMINEKIFFPELSYKITGILFSTHNQLGRYCNEKQYADEIEYQLKKLKIKYEREKVLPQAFESEKKGRNKADFLIEENIILEIKVQRVILREDYYQIKRYLQSLNKKLGILVNFREKYIKPRRILNSLA